MSWFVLHPPPGVQVVSFFVTARYKGQDDRDAFTDAVMEQLADLLGEPIPAYLTETTANFTCCACSPRPPRSAAAGRRLVLVVDGLDEDRGVTTGPDAYSIAALLPARPPAGLRVIVAGRPDPPIPADVPDDHPLRDPGIVRVLDASPLGGCGQGRHAARAQAAAARRPGRAGPARPGHCRRRWPQRRGPGRTDRPAGV